MEENIQKFTGRYYIYTLREEYTEGGYTRRGGPGKVNYYGVYTGGSMRKMR